jgi:hypothetical protein
MSLSRFGWYVNLMFGIMRLSESSLNIHVSEMTLGAMRWVPSRDIRYCYNELKSHLTTVSRFRGETFIPLFTEGNGVFGLPRHGSVSIDTPFVHEARITGTRLPLLEFTGSLEAIKKLL